MSDELQREIDRLTAENKKLAGDVAGLTDELKEVRHEARDRRHEAKGLAAQVESLTKERDDFKSRAEADPEGLRKAVADAHGVIRGMKHERAFEAVAEGLKVTDAGRLADLVKLAGYQPEGDEPDEAKIAESFGAVLKGRPWLIDPAATAAAEASAGTSTTTAAGAATTTPGGATVAAQAQPGRAPGPGADRGQSLSSGATRPEGRPSGRL